MNQRTKQIALISCVAAAIGAFFYFDLGTYLQFDTLQQSLGKAMDAQVVRLSRGLLGPFLFPGGPRFEGQPACMDGALVLHMVHELVSEDVRSGLHRDPWSPPPRGEQPPEGQAIYRERRLAASPPAVEPIRAWSEARGAPCVVVPLQPRPASGRRSL